MQATFEEIIARDGRLVYTSVGDSYVICGDNRWRRETGITDRHILGVLTAIVRNGETISVHDSIYLRKVHLWCDFFWLRAAILWMRYLPKRALRKLKRWTNRA